MCKMVEKIYYQAESIKRKYFASEISASCWWTDQGVICLSNRVHVTFGIAFGYLNADLSNHLSTRVTQPVALWNRSSFVFLFLC